MTYFPTPQMNMWNIPWPISVCMTYLLALFVTQTHFSCLWLTWLTCWFVTHLNRLVLNFGLTNSWQSNLKQKWPLMNFNVDWDRSVINSKVISRSQTKRQKINCIPEHFNYFGKSWVKISLVQPIAFGVSFDLNVQSLSPWSLFNGTWQKRPRELDNRLKFENEEMILHMQ